MIKSVPVITMDGPTASGKGTVSQMVASALHWHLLDSGALYRVVALAAIQHGVDLGNAKGLEVISANLDVQFKAAGGRMPPRVILEGQDVSELIRVESHGNFASKVASLPAVRAALMSRQRDFRALPGLVADGRDMGTVVFPDAQLKFYVNASPKVRALRRYLQLKEKGAAGTLAALEDEIRERDARDLARKVSPLKPADDAIVVDTSDLSVNQVFECVMKSVRKIYPDN